ncbi:MAG: MFS transporter [candidate division Zixibacteria bacterium]|nr:MFS transporter [candidate division Zixibacteria bacterium]
MPSVIVTNLSKAEPTKLVWNKEVISWSFYDFANTIYSMNIISLYLKRYIIEDLSYPDFYFDLPFSFAMLLTAIVAPALGAISDHQTKKKYFLLFFTLTCCIAVAGMGFAGQMSIIALLTLSVISNFAYEAGQPFYNALLYSVSAGKNARYISGVGVAFGYVGSVVGMLLVLPFVTGGIFSLDIPFIDGSGKVGAFVPTAVLFFLFSLPLFLVVKEKPVAQTSKVSIRKAYSEVWSGLAETKKYPGVLRFLVANFFFQDAVNTVILNIGLYCAIVLRFSDNLISLFLIVSTITAVVGSFIIGKLSIFMSLKKLVTWIVFGWIVALSGFVFVDYEPLVWAMGSLVGILLGGLWTTTRPMLAELVPKEELGRFFGLFAVTGRASAIFGPLIWTGTVLLFAPGGSSAQFVQDTFNISLESMTKLPYQIALLTLAIIMIIGLIIFRRVPDTRYRKDTHAA